jgi:hypothetical protein
MKGGILSSDGTIEASSKVTNVKVRNATIDSVDLIYVHQSQTREAEERRAPQAGKSIQKAEQSVGRPSISMCSN